MNKLFLFLFMSLLSNHFFGQTVRELPKRPELTQTYEEPQAKSLAAEESNYFGYDAKIKDVLLKESSFELVPMRVATESKEDFLKKLNQWLVLNSYLVKPDKKNTEIN